MDEPDQIPATMEDAAVVMVTVDAGDVPVEGARMSLDEDHDQYGNPRAAGVVPDAEGGWVAASVGEPDEDGLVSVFLDNATRPDAPD